MVPAAAAAAVEIVTIRGEALHQGRGDGFGRGVGGVWRGLGGVVDGEQLTGEVWVFSEEELEFVRGGEGAEGVGRVDGRCC